MCLLFSGLGLLNLHLMIAEPHGGRDKARLFVSFLFVLFAAVAIRYQFFFLRTVISEFQYDGSTLRFRTLGTQEPQFRPLADIASIRDWRGRGGQLGYRLQFQDGRKLYLEFSVSNSVALANRLRADLGS